MLRTFFVLLTLFHGLSCKTDREQEDDSFLGSIYPFRSFLPKTPEQTPIFFKGARSSADPIGTIYRRSCVNILNKKNPSVELSIPLNSVFGPQTIRINIFSEQDILGVLATTENIAIQIQPDPTSLRPADFCQLDEDNRHFVIDETHLSFLVSILKKIAPSCLSIDSLNCELTAMAPQLVEEKLHAIKKAMIRNWSRQPYILSRRLALSLNLSKIIQSDDAMARLDNFCNVLKFAAASELPLALASTRWQEYACNPHSSRRVEAVQIGLNSAVSEIELLKNLFEKTSRLGTLSVDIAKSSAPTRDLWISLLPSEDVGNNLKNEASGISNKNSDEDFSSLKSCWHQLFGSSDKTMKLANYLGLTDKTTNISCLVPSEIQSGDPVSDSSDYLSDSITSETEFVISNGNSKILRLPSGTYRYSITAHSDDLGWDPLPKEKSEGHITWTQKNPGAKITTW